MIVSGSLVPGVDPANFNLPEYTAFRMELPAPSLADYIADYQLYDSDEKRHSDVSEYMLPSWPAIRIILADRPMGVQLGNQLYDPMPRAALFGTTTQAMLATPHGGVTVAINLTPLGWARLFTIPASSVRDQVIPLADAMDKAVVNALVEELRGSNRSTDVKAILDRFLLTHMLPAHRDEAAIRKISQLIDDPDTLDLATSAERIGISAKKLSRMSNRHFGYPPKRLLMRTRFMRSFLPMFCGERRCDFLMIDPGYVDASHFLRDAARFLGTTPARFMAHPTPYLDAVLRARRIVLQAAQTERLAVTA